MSTSEEQEFITKAEFSRFASDVGRQIAATNEKVAGFDKNFQEINSRFDMLMSMMEKSQNSAGGFPAGRILSGGATISSESEEGKGHSNSVPASEALEDSNRLEVYAEQSLLSPEPQVVVTSSETKILTEEGPARCVVLITREDPLQPLVVERVEEKACAEIQSLLRMSTTSAVTGELSGRRNNTSVSKCREAYRFKAFKFRVPPFRDSRYSSLKQDVFNKSVPIREGEQGGRKKKIPACAELSFYSPGHRYKLWDPGGYDQIFLSSRGSRRRRKVPACADPFFYTTGSRYKLWDPGGNDCIILSSRGGERRKKKVPAPADLSIYPPGPQYILWDPGGYDLNILPSRGEGRERKEVPVPVDLSIYSPGHRYKLWDSGGHDFIILPSRGGRRGTKQVPACVDLSSYQPGYHYMMWEPGGYGSFDMAVRRGGGECGRRLQGFRGGEKNMGS